MAQIKLAEYTFDNTVGDVLPSLTPSTISMTNSDTVDGNITTRIVYIDNATMPTGINFTNVIALKTIEYLNLTSVKNINFKACTSLTSVNFSNQTAPNLTSLASVFYNTSALQTLDLTNFVAPNVSSMMQCFQNSGVKNIITTGTKISGLKEMHFAFLCSGITDIDLTGFDVSQVTSFERTFSECYSLININISNWNTESAISMNGMFSHCRALTSLDVSSFNTSNVTNMLDMFSGCRCLKSIDLTNFDTTSLNIAQGMFSQCHALESVDLSSFNTANVTTTQGMFYNDPSLQSVDLSNFDSSNIKTTKEMFYNCNKLKQVGLLYSNSTSINKIAENLNTSSNCDIYYCDADATQLIPVDNVTFIKYEFPTTISLPPHISLYASSNGTRDELDIKTGILTRRIGKFILNGTHIEHFHLNEQENGIHFTKTSETVGFGYNTLYEEYGFPYDGLYNGGCWSNIEITKNGSTFNTRETVAIWGMHDFNVAKMGIFIPNVSTKEDAMAWLNENPIELFYPSRTPTTEKIILNYNHSCDYGMVLPKGAVDRYDVLTGQYDQNIASIELNGADTWHSIEEFNKCVKIGLEGVHALGIKAGGGLYCDNDLFPNIDDNSDVEHCVVDPTTGGRFYFYIDKNRLSSPDLIGWQIWLQQNPFTMYYELAETKVLDKSYEELDPELARWEMMDSVKEGTISYTSNNDDGLTLYPNMTYVAPSVNNFDVEVLEPDTTYTVYAENVGGSLNLGGNTSNFTSGTTFTSGENKWLTFNSSPDVENIMLIKGDTTDEVVPYFTGVNSVVNPKVQTPNRNIFDGLIEKGFYGTGNGQPAGSDYRMRSVNYIKVKPNTIYTYSDGTNENVNILFYDEDKAFIKATTTITFTTPQNAHYIRFYTVYDGTSDLTSYQIQIEEGSVATGYVPHGGSTVTTNLTLRSSESGVKDSYNVLTGELIQRVDENLQVLETPITTTLEPQELLAYENGQILLSSESGMLPTMTYSLPSSNAFRLPSMRTGTRYTLKYPSASGSIGIGEINYKITGPSMLFTTPLTIKGDTTSIVFTDDDPQDVMLIEGDYSKREIPFFTGMRSSENIVITTRKDDANHTVQTQTTLRALPNGAADKLDLVSGQLLRVTGIRDYQEGDLLNRDVFTDQVKTVYPLSTPTVTTINPLNPMAYAEGNVELASDALIPTLHYRLPSSNNFVLELLKPETRYTLYANYEQSGSFTLGGTLTQSIGNAKTFTTADTLTDSYLTFDGDLGLSNVMLIEGDSRELTVPYFNGLLSVENATVSVNGSLTEVNRVVLPNTIKLRSLDSLIDELDLITGVYTKRIESKRLTGNESWQLGAIDTKQYISFKLVCEELKAATLTNLYCDRFNSLAWTSLTDQAFEFVTGSGTIEINIRKDRLSTPNIAGFKRWLNQYPTTVHYELAQPNITTLTLPWSSKPVSSFYGNTTIQTSVSQSLKPYLQVIIATTTLEDIVSDLKEKNASLEEENLSTMMAVTEVFEMIMYIMPSEATTINIGAPMKARHSSDKGGFQMVEVYVTLIIKGKKTLEQVPAIIRPQVEAQLIELGVLEA